MGTPWGKGGVGGRGSDGYQWDPEPLQKGNKGGKGSGVQRGVEEMGGSDITTCQIGVEESLSIPTLEKSMVRK